MRCDALCVAVAEEPDGPQVGASAPISPRARRDDATGRFPVLFLLLPLLSSLCAGSRCLSLCFDRLNRVDSDGALILGSFQIHVRLLLELRLLATWEALAPSAVLGSAIGTQLDRHLLRSCFLFLGSLRINSPSSRLSIQRI